MFCKYCGNRLPEDANFCPECGKVNDESVEKNATGEQKEYEAVDPFANTQSAYDPYKEEKDKLGGSILTFSILSLAFMSTFCLAFLGLIFACVSKSKLGVYTSKFGATEGRATVGKHLGTVGLITSIVMTVLCVIYFIAIIGMVVAGFDELLYV